ncbi:hypothetical protein PGT21_017479 [Puccinia graminis f. sp. tritici]|uniref:Uncharacterized protein n=1 Tax=Puccinia graminis f. sp. tritici TaxID=56615 RepID=A0A5B0NZC7_PUCGR|nr:hypothetical protein PGT21_017479 [Puccinia graminis f. sp. tritici]KAA1093450.1 hypothetical protein PGTUg99_017248 [Puccinia graminis f. sp. tritici]
MDLDDEQGLMARGLIRARSTVGMAPISASDRQEVQRNYADSPIASPAPSNQALLCDLARLATVFEDGGEKRPLGSPMSREQQRFAHHSGRVDPNMIESFTQSRCDMAQRITETSGVKRKNQASSTPVESHTKHLRHTIPGGYYDQPRQKSDLPPSGSHLNPTNGR